MTAFAILLTLLQSAPSEPHEPGGPLESVGLSSPCEPERFPAYIPLPSIAGFGFWTDIAASGQRRIQQHAVHRKVYRVVDVIDGLSWCVQCGELNECRRVMPRTPVGGSLRAKKAVVLIHGAWRNREATFTIERQLAKQGYQVVSFEYASAHLKIEESAACLSMLLESINAEQIDFVCHSMGGLVLRSCLDLRADQRVRRAVMLGVPNQGAELADYYAKCPLFRLLFGPAGLQLCTGPAGMSQQLSKSKPLMETALIAGCTEWNDPKSPTGFSLFAWDGVVSVDSTNWEGAVDRKLVRASHGRLLRDPLTMAAIEQFLSNGCMNKTLGRQKDFFAIAP